MDLPQPLDRFNGMFDWLTRTRANFYLTSDEKSLLMKTIPIMNKNTATGSELAERCARIRNEIKAAENQWLSPQQAELSIRAEANMLIRELEFIEGHPKSWRGRDMDLVLKLWEDWQIRVFHPFIDTHKRGEETDRLWQVYDCLSEIEVQFMAASDAILDLHAEDAKEKPLQNTTTETGRVDKEKQKKSDGTTGRAAMHTQGPAPLQSQAPDGLKPAANPPATADRKTEPSIHGGPEEASPVNQPVSVPPKSRPPPKASPGTTDLCVIDETVALQADQTPTATASFSVVEDIVSSRKSRKRPAPLQPTNYTLRDILNRDSSFPPTPGRPQLGSVFRRGGRSTPRVFNGSFSELEESIHKLRSSRPRNSNDPASAQHQQIKIKDFATPPQHESTATASSSPGLEIPLQKRHPQMNDKGAFSSNKSLVDHLQPEKASGGPKAQSTQLSPAVAHRAGSKSAGSSVVSKDPSQGSSSRNREHTL